MLTKTLQQITDEADVVVEGFAIKTLENGFIRVFNLSTNLAAVFLNDSTLVETNMNDNDLIIAQSILERVILNKH